MSEREICLSLISNHGYISRNLLARFLSISLKDSIKVLESVLPLPNSTVLYSTCINSKVTISNSKLSNSIIYAIGLDSRQSEFYDIEINLKHFFYQNQEIIYPPAASGIFIQEKRKLVLMDRVLKQNPMVTNAGTRKVEEKKKEEIKPSLGKPVPRQPLIQNLPLKSLNVRERFGASGQDPVKRVKLEEEKEVKGIKETGIEVNGAKSSEVEMGKTLGLVGNCLVEGKKSNEEMKMETKEKENEKRTWCNDLTRKEDGEKIKDIKSESQVKEKEIDGKNGLDTVGHIKVDLQSKNEKKRLKKGNDNINDILSNKNIYNTEEDEDTNPNTPNKAQIELKSSVPKSISQASLPQKKPKPVNDFFKSNAPLMHKRKVTKTRTVLENGKLVTEDYSSEEEIEIARPSYGLGKKEGVQQKISFFKKIDSK